MRKKIKADRDKCLIYIRVSTIDQVESGAGIAAQRSGTLAYCKMKGLEVLDILIDEGVSAGKPLASRPKGAEVLRRLASGEAGCVVALKLDRLFRNSIDCLTAVEGWGKTGIDLHLVDFGGQAVDTTSAIGKIFIHMLAGFAQFERDLVSDRTKAAMKELKKKNQRVGAIPYGKKLAKDKKTLIDSKKEIEVINLIKRWKSQRVSVPRITKRLNQGDTPNRGGKKWFTTQVYRVLNR